MEKIKFSLDEYLRALEQLVNIDSGSKDVAGTTAVADYFAEKFQQIGWQVKYHRPDPAVGPCLQITNQATDRYDILLIGHMDTVFAHGTAAKRPFAIKDNRAYGPGVVDMKASLLSVYYAVKHLHETGLPQGASICIAFNSDEEISSIHSRSWLEQLAANSRYVLVLEPARADGSMVNTRRGVGRYTLEFHGVASHSGVAPEKGVSAINELAHWVIALHNLTDHAQGTSLNVGVVQGGTTANTVADYAMAQMDVRMKEMSAVTRLQETLQYLLAHPQTPGITVKVSGGITRPPMNPIPETLELCKTVDAIAKRLGIAFQWIATGGASDANLTAALGVPTIDGLGPIGGLSHTVDEYLDIQSVEPRLLLLIELLAEMAEKSATRNSVKSEK